MLKITMHQEARSTTITLEGRLVGPWVEELDRCWREVAGSRPSHLLIDLTGATFIDAEGKALLARMWKQGAELRAAGCLTRCIVEDITTTGCADSSHSRRKGKEKRS